MLLTLLTAFTSVFAAELIGDRTLYTLGSLSSRFRVTCVMFGATIAFMFKMFIAVLFGRVLTRLPTMFVASVSALVFFATALILLLRGRDPEHSRIRVSRVRDEAGVAFSTIVLSEWADIGQLTAASLVAQGYAPSAVWGGATLAAMAKALLTVSEGSALRRWLPSRALRLGGTAVCSVMGVLAAFRIEF